MTSPPFSFSPEKSKKNVILASRQLHPLMLGLAVPCGRAGFGFHHRPNGGTESIVAIPATPVTFVQSSKRRTKRPIRPPHEAWPVLSSRRECAMTASKGALDVHEQTSREWRWFYAFSSCLSFDWSVRILWLEILLTGFFSCLPKHSFARPRAAALSGSFGKSYRRTNTNAPKTSAK